MKTDLFLQLVTEYKIPPSAPYASLWPGFGYSYTFSEEGWKARAACNKLGMWPIVTQDLARSMSEYIAGRKVLEIISGVGWLAKALTDAGVEIVATDDYSWHGGYKDMTSLVDVTHLDCREAVRTFDQAEILLVSWPHFSSVAFIEALKLWGPDRPVIYIGEGEGGCCAPDEFFELFRRHENINIPIRSWPGLHDSVWVGKIKQGRLPLGRQLVGVGAGVRAGDGIGGRRGVEILAQTLL